MSKNTEEKNDKKNILYYLNWKNLSAEVQGYGETLTMQKTLLYFFLYLGVMVALGILMSMNLLFIGIICASSLFVLPTMILNSYKNIYEQRRFSDISQYMQQILYSFSESGKISISLEDTKSIFPEGPMYDAIETAQEMYNSFQIGDDVEKNALKYIESKYYCEKLRTIHRFLLKVEEHGGECGNTISLLQQDRTAWVDRVFKLQQDKQKRKMNNVMSIICSIVLCIIMTRVLPDEVDITSSIIYQLGCLGLIIMDILIYVMTDKAVAVDWLSQKEIASTEDTKRRYEYITNFDPKREFKQSIKWLVIPLGIILFGIVEGWKILVGAGILLIPVMLFQHRINYALSKKMIVKEIKIKFPRWLMEIALLLQSTNVQMALFQSIENAPIVLVPELNKLKGRLEEDPTDKQAYLDFMDDFKIPEIQSSMKMLRSINGGAGGNSGEQITEIIHRNNEMLDKAELQANEDRLANLYVLFLLPQVTACFKIIVDMMLFFAYFLPALTDRI